MDADALFGVAILTLSAAIAVVIVMVLFNRC